MAAAAGLQLASAQEAGKAAVAVRGVRDREGENVPCLALEGN